MAQALYCTAADLLLPSEALAELQTSDVARAIVSASSEADSYIATAIPLPLRPPLDPQTQEPVYPAALTNAVAQIATYRAMLLRGYAPMAGQNDTIRGGYNDAIAFLKAVSKKDAVLQVRGSDAEAEIQDGTGPSGSPYVSYPAGAQGGSYSADEDFWHDRPSVTGGSGAFSGSGRRGY